MSLGRLRFGSLRLLPAGVLAAVAISLGGCAAISRTPYTDAEAQEARVAIEGARTWADTPEPGFLASSRAAIAPKGPVTYLALSGGGGDGAFGAGILNGWTEAGTRPDFTIVSGVSTGALIAPFAFLGPRYDLVLRELYTSGLAETLLSSPDPFRAIFGSALFSNDRLRELVSRYVTDEIIAEIAAERRRGRMLLVVTTNLDTQRPVLWDLGVIAASDAPGAKAMFRDVLVASASIPAVFPPILIDAHANGNAFQELHVDGTITSSVFTLPRSYLWSDRLPLRSRKATIYVLMNAKLEPDFNLVPNNAAEIGVRTFSTFVRNGSRADIMDTYRLARRRGIGFNLVYIDRDVPTESGAGFDTPHMRRLYRRGYERARGGRFWESAPPGAGGASLFIGASASPAGG